MEVREATAADAEAVSRLLSELGYPATARAVSERLDLLTNWDRVLVTGDGRSGLVAVHRIPRLAEGDGVARITALVVAADARRHRVATALIAAAEDVALEWDCSLMEVSSGRRPQRDAAHAFYEALGYTDAAQSSVRYWKVLE
jgi:GNAT superfamily N-acetyltransferase